MKKLSTDKLRMAMAVVTGAWLPIEYELLMNVTRAACINHRPIH
ncbi:hypothetical protein QQ054_03480 [Oscillatoria amoena NRMC-F 0135]|nr:hypothetical protein [Oscillatoria amoena NRMC-F 0135]